MDTDSVLASWWRLLTTTPEGCGYGFEWRHSADEVRRLLAARIALEVHSLPDYEIKKMDCHPTWKQIEKTRLLERAVVWDSLQVTVALATGSYISDDEVLIFSRIDPHLRQPLLDKTAEAWLEKVVRIRIPEGRHEGKFLRFHTVCNYLDSIHAGPNSSNILDGASTREEVEEAVSMYQLFTGDSLHFFTSFNLEIRRGIKCHRNFDLMFDLRGMYRRRDPIFSQKKRLLNDSYYEATFTSEEGRRLKSEKNKRSYSNRKAKLIGL